LRHIAELYGIMVDPLAEGTISVSTACDAIRKAALKAREDAQFGPSVLEVFPHA
jgi:hypothetical protein